MYRIIVVLLMVEGATALAADSGNVPTIAIKVTEHGFEPREVQVKRNRPVALVFTRLTDATCIRAIDIPAENVKHLDLPLDKPVSVTITPKKAGVEEFHCSAMAMGDGKLIVSD
jgi:plastocyanin domain-containing protein